MRKDDRIYLEHILESFSKVGHYLRNVDYETFLADEEKQDAIIRKIEIAGEASKRLSPETREKFNQIPNTRKIQSNTLARYRRYAR